VTYRLDRIDAIANAAMRLSATAFWVLAAAVASSALLYLLIHIWKAILA
jgi:hypothetical protein